MGILCHNAFVDAILAIIKAVIELVYVKNSGSAMNAEPESFICFAIMNCFC